jgi:hypothetical protein
MNALTDKDEFFRNILSDEYKRHRVMKKFGIEEYLFNNCVMYLIE